MRTGYLVMALLLPEGRRVGQSDCRKPKEEKVSDLAIEKTRSSSSQKRTRSVLRRDATEDILACPRTLSRIRGTNLG
jgi:hypothetical protein